MATVRTGDIHTGCITLTKQVIFRNKYVHAYTYIHVIRVNKKGSREEFMGGFVGRREGKNVIKL